MPNVRYRACSTCMLFVVFCYLFMFSFPMRVVSGSCLSWSTVWFNFKSISISLPTGFSVHYVHSNEYG